jgi:lysyl-tRNA synthetase class 1
VSRHSPSEVGGRAPRGHPPEDGPRRHSREDWADELAASVSGRQVVNDSKTPSGTVHVGSLRGPVILDTIWRALRARGLEAHLLYGVDDYDPMDAQALLTPDAVDREMGRPLFQVPDPFGDCHPSYARHFAGVFIDTFAELGIRPERYYWMSDIYPTGQMDPYIRSALDKAAVVRDIYRRIANVQHPDTWHPLSVICESCGKIGTTIVTGWDGERVAYQCRPNLVDWATGCGYTGWTTPFGGRAKLPWNLEWAAQWSLLGVTIEPCGKDLATAGGSRDRSDAIAREVFEREPPLNVPYEFINIGGKKMSTSKGRGAAAHEIVGAILPEQLRFFFLRPKPNHAVEFEPEGTDAIPRLYDEFDRFAAATAGREVKGEIAPGYEATFRYSLLNPHADVPAEAALFRPAFAHLALLLQIPNVDVVARMEAEKGSPLNDREREILEQRTGAARRWLAVYAPERARLAVRRDALPDEAAALDDSQRAYLATLATGADASRPAAGDSWQDLIFSTASELGLEPKAAFAALYLAFLGRANGPRAGWLLASLDPDFVVGRLREAAAASVGGAA